MNKKKSYYVSDWRANKRTILGIIFSFFLIFCLITTKEIAFLVLIPIWVMVDDLIINIIWGNKDGKGVKNG